MMVTLVCSSCDFTLEMDESPKTRQDCPICSQSKLMVLEKQTEPPGETELLVPDYHRSIEWCDENLESNPTVAIKALFIHALTALSAIGNTADTCAFIERIGIRILSGILTSPDTIRKLGMNNNWLDAVVHSLVFLSRFHRMGNNDNAKLNGELEKLYMAYNGISYVDAMSSENERWE